MHDYNSSKAGLTHTGIVLDNEICRNSIVNNNLYFILEQKNDETKEKSIQQFSFQHFKCQKLVCVILTGRNSANRNDWAVVATMAKEEVKKRLRESSPSVYVCLILV